MYLNPPQMLNYKERLAKTREGLGTDLSAAERAPESSVALAGKPWIEPPAGTITINGRTVVPDMSRAQGYGFTGREATADQIEAGLMGSPEMNTPATDPTAPVAPVALGRHSPDPRAYFAESGPTAPGGATSGTMLPVGNPRARDALLRMNFPGATRQDMNALGALAFNRPEQFNASVAGTRLDPTMMTEHRAQATAQLDATQVNTASARQAMALAGPTAGAHLNEAWSRTVAINAANAQHAQNSLAWEKASQAKTDGTGQSGLEIYMAHGGNDPQHLAHFDRNKTWSPTGAVTPPGTTTRMLPTSPNSWMPDPGQKTRGTFAEPQFYTNKRGNEFMLGGDNANWQQVHDDTKFMTPMEWVMSGQRPAEYWPARKAFEKSRKLNDEPTPPPTPTDKTAGTPPTAATANPGATPNAEPTRAELLAEMERRRRARRAPAKMQ